MVLTREKAYAGFAQRLREALDAIEHKGCPKNRGRATWLQKRYKVSNEAARKWLLGRAMPDQANLSRIAEDTGFTVTYLQSGTGLPRAELSDPITLSIREVWQELSDDERLQILGFAKAIAAGGGVARSLPEPFPVRKRSN